ncbi:hypothetical protein GF359_01690 [candidate division WOR-3 bacterium]|uniref:Lipoprotein n=1 Tax=candidate division WOR-3 bacterium TaxID=2052148 RepID=A0A9D5K9T6_UNCW3|nr:hypothetical protein [candidate division WOR-3 bacterium]MBD3363906.1 hypothetical protein [candidate division WOR-3 bacterium]
MPGMSMRNHWLLTITFALTTALGCSKLSGNYTDKTYFPIGEGYEWVNLRQNYRTVEDKDSVSFDTVSIRVTSKTTTNEWTTYKLEGGAFEDVGEEVLVSKDGILVFGGVDTIPLIPPEDFKPKESVIGYGLGYRDSVLTISLYSGGGYVLMVYSTERVKGVGVISQEAELRSPPHYEGHIDRLMYFIKDGDTVWRYEETP